MTYPTSGFLKRSGAEEESSHSVRLVGAALVSSQSSGRALLPFLDGMRGLAALYVTLHHAAIMVPPDGMSWGPLRLVLCLYMGHAAVSVFIVLSGYCLM